MTFKIIVKTQDAKNILTRVLLQKINSMALIKHFLASLFRANDRVSQTSHGYAFLAYIISTTAWHMLIEEMKTINMYIFYVEGHLLIKT